MAKQFIVRAVCVPLQWVQLDRVARVWKWTDQRKRDPWSGDGQFMATHKCAIVHSMWTKSPTYRAVTAVSEKATNSFCPTVYYTQHTAHKFLPNAQISYTIKIEKNASLTGTYGLTGE